jgi:hypothetical protein
MIGNSRNIFILTMLLWWPAQLLLAQYTDNPLKGRRWISFSAGVNTADYYSWQGMISYTKRGDASLTQVRVAHTQELLFAPNDSCTSRLNRLSEFALLWGDGWGGKKWYVTGAVGFGLNVRMFCRQISYEDQYITSVTVGVPVQVEMGVYLGKKSAIGLIGTGNWNFRESYAGLNLAYTYRLSKISNAKE